MPFRSNNYSKKKRRTYKKKKTYGLVRYGKPTTYDYARTAYKNVMKLKRYVHPEFKVHYFAKLSEVMGTTWSIASLCAMSQGDNDQAREGIMIKPINLTCKLWMKKGATDLDATQFRVIILRGKHEAGTTADLALAYDGGNPSISEFLRFKENGLKFNSKTLHDKTYKFEASNTINNLTSRYVEFNIRLNGTIKYTPEATTCEDGGIYMLYAASNDDASFDWHSKLSYTDN